MMYLYDKKAKEAEQIQLEKLTKKIHLSAFA
jgi:hypothetical protein